MQISTSLYMRTKDHPKFIAAQGVVIDRRNLIWCAGITYIPV
jgi:hypothetical protein